MKRSGLVVFVVLAFGVLVWFFLNQKNSSDDFLKKQAIQSALFPVLGPVLKDTPAQPAFVILKPEALGVVLTLRSPISDHADRENLRAQVMVIARDWAKTRPELQSLHVFVQFDDELK